MAIKLITQIHDPDEQSTSASQTVTETICYRVEVDDKATPLSAARLANDGTNRIPQPGEQMTVNGVILTVRDVNARRQIESPFHFIVRVTAGTPQGSGNSEKIVTDISVDWIPYREPIYTDINGRAITNTAGIYFDPPLEQDYADEEITISFSSNAVDLDQIRFCRGKVNAGPVTLNVTVKGANYQRSFAPKTLKLDKARYGITTGDGKAIWKINYIFIWRADGWKRKAPNLSLFEKSGSGTNVTYVRVHDERYRPSAVPLLLGTSGAQLAFGATPPDPLEFELDFAADFSGLFSGLTDGIPTPPP